MIIALNGLLFQTKRNIEGPAHWRNLNLFGRIFFALVMFLTGLNILAIYTNENKHTNEVNQLLISQNELKEINRHLIKVMSVADGYNAIISGVVTFNKEVNEIQIRSAIANLFLKYVEIDIQAENKLGIYHGRIDYGAHPEVRKYLNLSNVEFNNNLSIEKQHFPRNSYFYEIRCSGVKILNDDKIQYARFNLNEKINVKTKKFDWSSDFRRIYNVESVFIEECIIEELETFHLNKTIYF
jgi:hypothetical protein